jgi:hypothetical protein
MDISSGAVQPTKTISSAVYTSGATGTRCGPLFAGSGVQGRLASGKGGDLMPIFEFDIKGRLSYYYDIE